MANEDIQIKTGIDNSGLKKGASEASKEIENIGKSAEKVDKNLGKVGASSSKNLGMSAELAGKLGDKINDAGDGVQALDALMGQFGLKVSVLGSAIGLFTALVIEIKKYNEELTKTLELQDKLAASRFLAGKQLMTQEAIKSQAENLLTYEPGGAGLVGAERQKKLQEISSIFGVRERVSAADYKAISGLSKTGITMDEAARLLESQNIEQLSSMTGLKADQAKMTEADKQRFISDAQKALRGKGMALYGQALGSYKQKLAQSNLGGLIWSEERVNQEIKQAENLGESAYKNMTAWNQTINQINSSGIYSQDFNRQAAAASNKKTEDELIKIRELLGKSINGQQAYRKTHNGQ